MQRSNLSRKKQQLDAKGASASRRRTFLRRLPVIGGAAVTAAVAIGVVADQGQTNVIASQNRPTAVAGHVVTNASTCAPSTAPVKVAKVSDPTVTTPAPFIDPGEAKQFGVPAPKGATISFHIYMKLNDRAGAIDFAKLVSSPTLADGSPNPQYRKYMSADEFDACFGATQPQANELTDFFGGLRGMTFNGNPSNLNYLSFTGTVAQINKAFQTQIYIVDPGDGSLLFLPAGQPTIPKTLAPYIQGIGGLDGAIGVAHGIRSVAHKPSKVFALPVVKTSDPIAVRHSKLETISAINIGLERTPTTSNPRCTPWVRCSVTRQTHRLRQ